MQTLRGPSLLLFGHKTLPTAANFGSLLGLIAPIGCAMVFAVGCAHTASVHGPLAGSDHASTTIYRSHKHARRGESLGPTRIVTASWYGPGYAGKPTANGERFDPNRLTAASRTLPLDSIVRVTNLRNRRSVDVKINDRGPRKRGRGIDLSPAAARKIGLTNSGVAHVKIKPVTKATD
jgi:rare lipoprotein A (peptidoglycan hydrolase)